MFWLSCLIFNFKTNIFSFCSWVIRYFDIMSIRISLVFSRKNVLQSTYFKNWLLFLNQWKITSTEINLIEKFWNCNNLLNWILFSLNLRITHTVECAYTEHSWELQNYSLYVHFIDLIIKDRQFLRSPNFVRCKCTFVIGAF